MANSNVWVVDDDRSIRWVLERALEQAGMTAMSFDNGDAMLQRLTREQPDVIISDIRMPGIDGIALLERVHHDLPKVPVIIMTAHSDLESAVSSYQSGAFDYLPKPFDVDDAMAMVRRAVTHAHEQRSETVPEEVGPTEIIGQAPAMQEVFRAIGRLSHSNVTVLINGESGSGKELVARALHRHSPRAATTFIALNMAAIPKDLVEAELFGHEKGAFTGATALKKGLIEASAGGTLFLDEVTEMTPSMQVKLLRVLQEKEVLRVGGTRAIKSDVRVLAASNRDVNEAIKNGSFREDLYFRLNVVNLRIPPLAQRKGDIPLLARHFLLKYASRMKKPVTRIASEVLARLMDYSFPGNVRELENLIERGTAMAQGDTIEVAHLPETFHQAEGFSLGKIEGRLPTLDEQEHTYINRVLEEVKGNQTVAAQILGINRASLWRKLKARRGM